MNSELDKFGAVENTVIATEVREVVALKLTKVQSIFSFVLYGQKKEQFTFIFFVHVKRLKLRFEV